MKKNKLVNVIVSLALTLLFYNCQNEPLEQNIDLSEASKVLSGIKQENTTLQEIKNDPYFDLDKRFLEELSGILIVFF